MESLTTSDKVKTLLVKVRCKSFVLFYCVTLCFITAQVWEGIRSSYSNSTANRLIIGVLVM